MEIDAEALTKWREARGYSKVPFAKDNNISVQYLCDIERGDRKLSRNPALIQSFARTLDIPVTYLIKREPVAVAEAAS